MSLYDIHAHPKGKTINEISNNIVDVQIGHMSLEFVIMEREDAVLLA